MFRPHCYSLTLATLLVCCIGCKTTDLRVENSPIAGSDSLASAILEKTLMTYGGIAAWKAQQSIQIEMTDSWPTFIWRLIASPWKQRDTKLSLAWEVLADNGRLQQLDGKHSGKESGIQFWRTYRARNSKIEFIKDKEMYFHIPTMMYLFEFPFRIAGADVLRFAGEKQINGKDYSVLFATWHNEAPQRDLDQYLLFINNDTMEIDFLEFTVRAQGKWTYATISFSDIRAVGQVKIPFLITAYFQNSPPGQRIGHRMTVEKVNTHIPASKNYFVPDSTYRAMKSLKWKRVSKPKLAPAAEIF